MNLSAFNRFNLSAEQVAQTEKALAEAGDEGYERFVFWSGRPAGNDRFGIEAVHVPAQVSYRTADGLLVRVEGPELHRLNIWLYEHDEMLAAQVHAHPADAYHSPTDDCFPIVTIEGGLSIVVPNFCQDGLISSGTAIFRLRPGGWIEDEGVSLEVS